MWNKMKRIKYKKKEKRKLLYSSNAPTLYLGFPPINAAFLAYSEIGLLFPTADTGLFTICCVLKKIQIHLSLV